MAGFCPQCGASHEDDARFCPKCGRPLGAAAPLSYSETYRSADMPPAATAQPARRSRAVLIAIALVVVASVAAIALVYAEQQTNKILQQTNNAIASILATPQAPSFAPPAATGGLNGTASLGEDVPIVNAQTNAPLGDQAVVAVKRNATIAYLAPDAGKTFVGVEVRYTATAEMSYSPADWVVHDQDGAQYTWQGMSLSPALATGTLAAGRHVAGWIVFEVPKSTPHLWADRQNPDGSVIFSVQLY